MTKHEVKLRKQMGREERKTKRHLKKLTPKYLCIEPPLHKVKERYEKIKVARHCNPEGILQYMYTSLSLHIYRIATIA